MAERTEVSHGFPPFYLPEARTLILGSFPSVKSREQAFFYGHPQNRFWPVMAALCGEAVPGDIPAKRAFLTRHRLALYDVIERCSIEGSSDSSIRDVEPADIGAILRATQVGERVYTNGTTAYTLYMKYVYPMTHVPARKLPSTSPANAAWRLERLIVVWGEALGDL